ncbi:MULTISPECIES: MIP/aquaporin family protein [unclassified Streptomyces]|uniref:MIP/aquaporin family protein n=1 Tax=unclassified Streptomyces TaxID=2593676 RepID=UPI002DD9979A|nr:MULTISPECIES: MIP/aquaporin family protein [unclassified Streptomyces]WSA90899.1 aquaporin family protein [Streptomyces sp. NBC_01795]WSB75222.1 aquaporin family protein [Streptomyces sp. NBC_01775]WSS16494.1 aquaporin family protein [Streptomyces sp. NBC_01186]WSS45312.1 aquaporin family protein [Streptomyces sp. NBC_01187]
MSAGSIFLWELLGTAVLIMLGTGVVANNVLRKTNGNDTGTLFVNIGWGFAVFTGASLAAPSGAHLNPAITLALAVADKTDWADVPIYFLAQMLGGILGAVLCWATYKLQFDDHDDPGGTLGVFSTVPTIPNKLWNTVTETLGTFVLVAFVLFSPVYKQDGGVPNFGNSALGYAGVAFVVLVIGTSLGGPTGYAINPARDLGPRLAYAFILPIKGKGPAQWAYSWVPVVGPMLGGVLAALLYLAYPSA